MRDKVTVTSVLYEFKHDFKEFWPLTGGLLRYILPGRTRKLLLPISMNNLVGCELNSIVMTLIQTSVSRLFIVGINVYCLFLTTILFDRETTFEFQMDN